MEPTSASPRRAPWAYDADRRAVRRDVLWLLALGLVLFGAGLGLRHPWPADEPRFALVALEMVETGDWFFPHRGGELYADKPPLFMWAIALSYRLTGSLKVAFLLPSLLASLGTLLLVYDLGRRLWHRRVGWAAGLALLTIVQFTLQARYAQIDASVTFWTTLGLYGVCRHLLLGPAWGWWAAGCFAMGLGVITKGVGFLPLLALIPWAIGRRRDFRRLNPTAPSKGRWLLGPLALFAAIGLWLVPMVLLVAQRQDPALEAYRDDILWGQTAERYTVFKGHQQPFWYYPVEVIPSLWMPASLLLPWLVPAWRRRLRRGDGRYLVLLGWVVLVVVFFTFSAGKRGVYVLPAVPALALACGPLLAARLDRVRSVGRAAFGLLVGLSSLLLLAGASGLAGAAWAAKITRREGFDPWSLAAALGLMGLAWALLLGVRRGLPALAGFLAGCWLVLGLWAYPLLDPLRSSTLFMKTVAAAVDPGTELAMVGFREQMLLHAARPVVHWGYLNENKRSEQTDRWAAAAATWLREDPRRVVLGPQPWLEPCVDFTATVPLGEWHRLEWHLVTSRALLAGCQSALGEAAHPPTRPRFLANAWKTPADGSGP